jgi:uncharacterized membrane-anchored protein
MGIRPGQLLALVTLVLAAPLAAQGKPSFEDIPWERGPIAGSLGADAEVKVPAECMFTGAAGAKQFMELTENPVDGTERGVILCNTAQSDSTGPWFIVFSFAATGYVKDDEKDKLDAGAILASIRRGTDAGNREREKHGWGTITIDGWAREPYYDSATHNLTWATRLSAGDDHTINHSIRLLGRSGVMHADLVTSAAQYATVLPAASGIIGGFSYTAGHRYSEWRSGDKVAAYGLTALVAGGAGAALVGSGLLAKFAKVIMAGIAGLAAAIRSRFSRKKAPAGATVTG